MDAVPSIKFNQSELIGRHTNPRFWPGIFLSPDEFDVFEKIAWMQRNWMISIYASIIYIGLIFGLREFMKNREAFDLKKPLILWNLSLAIFSIKGAYVSIEAMIEVLNRTGLDGSICATLEFVNPTAKYWGTLFIFSKIVELADTLFLVLRKRPLIFLHWYHHISVLIFSWITYKDVMSTGGWAGTLNYTVHAFMYTYFTLTALRWKVPKPIAMSITAVQFLQMIVMLFVHCYAALTKLMGNECQGVSNFHLWLAFGLFSSYAILFGKFFVNSYLGSSNVLKAKRK